MSQKLIRNSAAISIGALILGGILLIAMGSLATVVVVLCLIVCVITAAMSYFGALVKTARMRRIGWFVGILLTGVLGTLIYGLVGPETKISDEPMPSFLYRSYKRTKKTMGF